MDEGPCPTVKLTGEPKPPEPFPSRTETEPSPCTPVKPATARSGLPSALKSAVTIEIGFEGTENLEGAEKSPAPSPRRTETSPENVLAAATSSLPSALKSAFTIATGCALVSKVFHCGN